MKEKQKIHLKWKKNNKSFSLNLYKKNSAKNKIEEKKKPNNKINKYIEILVFCMPAGTWIFEKRYNKI